MEIGKRAGWTGLGGWVGQLARAVVLILLCTQCQTRSPRGSEGRRQTTNQKKIEEEEKERGIVLACCAGRMLGLTVILCKLLSLVPRDRTLRVLRCGDAVGGNRTGATARKNGGGSAEQRDGEVPATCGTSRPTRSMCGARACVCIVTVCARTCVCGWVQTGHIAKRVFRGCQGPAHSFFSYQVPRWGYLFPT